MLDRHSLNAKPIEDGEKVFGCRGHERPDRSEIEFSSKRVLNDAPVALMGCFWHRTALYAAYMKFGCGCSSGVEHNLAKVGVVGSNPIARSKIAARKSKKLRRRAQRSSAFIFSSTEPPGQSSASPSWLSGFAVNSMRSHRSCDSGST